MGVVVQFSYDAWSQRYPEFGAVDPNLVELYSQEAQLYIVNDGSGPVCNAAVQSALLNMVTAHICQLNAPSCGTPVQTGGPQIAGAITSATEGSVSVTTQLDLPPGSATWFAQTKYGLAFWQATAGYRTMKYAPKPYSLGLAPWSPWGRGGYN